MIIQTDSIKEAGLILTGYCHGLAKQGGWWNNLRTGEDLTIDHKPENRRAEGGKQF